MDTRPWLPVQLDVGGRRCVVVGAGPVGMRRARALLDAGASVVLVDPVTAAVAPPVGVQRLLQEPGALAVGREFEPADLDGALLVVAATGDAAVDAAVSAAAAERGVLVNRADRASLGDLSFPAVVRRGPLVLAVSSGAAAPAVSRLVAQSLDVELDRVLGLDAAAVEALVEVVAEVRDELAEGSYGGSRGRDDTLREAGVTPGPLDWRSALDASILDLIRQGRRAEAKERLLACLSSS